MDFELDRSTLTRNDRQQEEINSLKDQIKRLENHVTEIESNHLQIMQKGNEEFQALQVNLKYAEQSIASLRSEKCQLKDQILAHQEAMRQLRIENNSYKSEIEKLKEDGRNKRRRNYKDVNNEIG